MLRNLQATIQLSVLAMGLTAMSSQAFALDGDEEAGEKLFKKCAICHSIEDTKNKVGPHLVGVIDRPVATVDGFKYSKAMTEFGADGKVWDEALLAEYMAAPKAIVKGTKMAFAGLKKEQEIADVIAYLKAHPAE